MKYYIVPKDALEDLYRKALLFNILESSGVDNWIGYDDSFKEFLEDENLDWDSFEDYISKECEIHFPIKE